jgi:ABC-type uncharacterized transport system substrate-binding protein
VLYFAHLRDAPLLAPGMITMTQNLLGRLAATLLVMFALGSAAALAHPHVWVTIKSEIVYGPDGAVTGVRHAWTFDDMFSTFALQGLESKVKGQFTRDELAPLAEVNISSLKDFDFFTYGRADAKKVAFEEPQKGKYWLDYKDSALTLNFTLQLKSPVKAKDFNVEVYDPTYFVDFSLTEKDPIVLAGAPAGCKVDVSKPKELNIAQGQKLGEAFFNQLDSSNYGSQFANKIAVKCP